jgi:hypothetical protein
VPFSRHYFHVLSTLKSKEEYEEKVITHKNVRANKIIHPCDALENKEFEE